MISYNEALIIVTLLLTVFFVIVVLKAIKTKKLPFAGPKSSDTPKTHMVLPILLLTILFSLAICEFVYPPVALFTRFSTAVMLGIFLFTLNTESKQFRIALSIVACFLLLFPKIAVTLEFPYAKSSADAWSHLKGVIDYGQNSRPEYVDYYTGFPIVYSQISFLSYATGIDAFYSSTIYYFIVNLLTALILYKICHVVAIQEKWNSKKSSAPLIGMLMYSIASYPNISILKELPQSTGLLGMCLAVYVILRMEKGQDRRFAFLGIFAALLSLSHPFAPIFVALFLFLYRILKIGCEEQAVVPSLGFALIPLIMLILYYSLLYSFNNIVVWFKNSLMDGVRILLGMSSGPGPTERFREIGMDIKFPSVGERLLYAFNWALPVAAGLSLLLVLGLSMLKHKSTQTFRTPSVFLNTVGIMSVLLSGFAFTFSFVEYAFSRYFGTYAALISVPAIAYIVEKGLNKSRLTKAIVISIVVLSATATLTECSFLPSVQIGNYYVRSRLVTSEISTPSELSAASFFAVNLPRLSSVVFTDQSYASTVGFFLGFNSSLDVETFEYPVSSYELQLFSQTHANYYAVIREMYVFYVENVTSVVFYSNGETNELLVLVHTN